ncbi:MULTISPECIES: universal stress protein [Nocardia]|uniref:universal stress protein n=1 Tax=Nocardia TaxID=1817 RepID=UPI002931797A|nr:universal stress protein [Nocardia canadensis]
MSTHRTEEAHELATSAVVVGTDGSAAADVAVRWAAQTAAERGRRLLIVHGLDLARTAAVNPYAVVTPAVIDAVRAHGTAVLADAERTAREAAPGVEVRTELVAGHPAQTLISLSRRAHLVALGATPDVGALAHLGSTLLAVTAHGSGRIVVVDTGTGPAPRRTGPIVVGVDGSPTSEQAIAAAFTEASERTAPLVAVLAGNDTSFGEFAGEFSVDDQQASDQALLAERLAGWNEKYPDVPVTHRVYPADARQHLQEWSDSAQMVVVGSHGWGGLRGLVLGSTSNWLVQHAHCPVMVAHPVGEDLR